MDWNALLDVYRAGVDKFPEYDGLNFSRGLLDPVNAIIKLVGKTYWAPKGPNWGHFESPETEALIEQIFNQFDDEKRLSLLTELHELEGRLGGDDLCRPRPQSAGDVAQGRGLRAGPELVPGFDAGQRRTLAALVPPAYCTFPMRPARTSSCREILREE